MSADLASVLAGLRRARGGLWFEPATHGLRPRRWWDRRGAHWNLSDPDSESRFYPRRAQNGLWRSGELLPVPRTKSALRDTGPRPPLDTGAIEAELLRTFTKPVVMECNCGKTWRVLPADLDDLGRARCPKCPALVAVLPPAPLEVERGDYVVVKDAAPRWHKDASRAGGKRRDGRHVVDFRPEDDTDASVEPWEVFSLSSPLPIARLPARLEHSQGEVSGTTSRAAESWYYARRWHHARWEDVVLDVLTAAKTAIRAWQTVDAPSPLTRTPTPKAPGSLASGRAHPTWLHADAVRICNALGFELPKWVTPGVLGFLLLRTSFDGHGAGKLRADSLRQELEKGPRGVGKLVRDHTDAECIGLAFHDAVESERRAGALLAQLGLKTARRGVKLSDVQQAAANATTEADVVDLRAARGAPDWSAAAKEYRGLGTRATAGGGLVAQCACAGHGHGVLHTGDHAEVGIALVDGACPRCSTPAAELPGIVVDLKEQRRDICGEEFGADFRDHRPVSEGTPSTLGRGARWWWKPTEAARPALRQAPQTHDNPLGSARLFFPPYTGELRPRLDDLLCRRRELLCACDDEPDERDERDAVEAPKVERTRLVRGSPVEHGHFGAGRVVHDFGDFVRVDFGAYGKREVGPEWLRGGLLFRANPPAPLENSEKGALGVVPLKVEDRGGSPPLFLEQTYAEH